MDGLSITVNAGEVVGIAGVSGNGQRELAQGIVGLMKVTGGSVNLSGKDITGTSVLQIDQGRHCLRTAEPARNGARSRPRY